MGHGKLFWIDKIVQKEQLRYYTLYMFLDVSTIHHNVHIRYKELLGSKQVQEYLQFDSVRKLLEEDQIILKEVLTRV